jgi:hypothetical protein
VLWSCEPICTRQVATIAQTGVVALDRDTKRFAHPRVRAVHAKRKLRMDDFLCSRDGGTILINLSEVDLQTTHSPEHADLAGVCLRVAEHSWILRCAHGRGYSASLDVNTHLRQLVQEDLLDSALMKT